jgi:hypothetical protein
MYEDDAEGRVHKKDRNYFEYIVIKKSTKNIYLGRWFLQERQ